jgi:hypothetical protein
VAACSPASPIIAWSSSTARRRRGDGAAIDALVKSTKLDGGNGQLGMFAGEIAIRGTCVPLNQSFPESTVKVRS